MKPTTLVVAVGLALTACAPPALAQSPKGAEEVEALQTARAGPVAAPVSLQDLVAEALRRNREILAAQKNHEAAGLRPRQESALPDPTVSFGYRNMGSPLPFTAISDDPNANAGVSYAQEIPFPGKLKLRGQMAQKEADAAFREYQNTQLRVVARLKQAYYQLHYVYKALDSFQKNKDLLDRFAKIAESRYTVGRAQQQDVLKAQVEVSLILNRVRRLEQEKQTLQAEINALLDRPPDYPIARPSDYTRGELRWTLDQLYVKAEEQSPEIGREQAMVEKSELAMNLARREYYPDFGIMGGYFNSGRFPDMYEFRFDVKVPLFFWRKQRAAVQEQNARLSASRHQYASTLRMHHFGIRETFLAAQTADELARLYSGGILPQAALALESSVAGYQTGAVDFLTLITNFRTVLDYEVSYYEEVATFQKALARLEELIGLPM